MIPAMVTNRLNSYVDYRQIVPEMLTEMHILVKKSSIVFMVIAICEDNRRTSSITKDNDDSCVLVTCMAISLLEVTVIIKEPCRIIFFTLSIENLIVVRRRIDYEHEQSVEIDFT